jgi:GH15 family glucan-1,4-alpha-glucosidase
VALRIEDYALIGDTETAALVGKNGSIDWLCAPRFDSSAFFAALLGTEANGDWQIAAAGGAHRVERRYRPGTLVLETDFETDDGLVRLVDCMPPGEYNNVVRIVEGLRGREAMQMQVRPRFDYGRLIPATGPIDQGIFAVAGPDVACMRTNVELSAEGGAASAAFMVAEGELVPKPATEASRLSGRGRSRPLREIAATQSAAHAREEW